MFGTSEITIEAPAPAAVWELMSNIDRWPTWNKGISEASLAGELKTGSTFRWKSGASRIVSTLREVDPLKEMAWSGKSMGVTAIHVWRLRANNGSTTVTTEESWEGMTAHLLRRWSQTTVDKALSDGLMYLKTEAERRS